MKTWNSMWVTHLTKSSFLLLSKSFFKVISIFEIVYAWFHFTEIVSVTSSIDYAILSSKKTIPNCTRKAAKQNKISSETVREIMNNNNECHFSKFQRCYAREKKKEWNMHISFHCDFAQCGSTQSISGLCPLRRKPVLWDFIVLHDHV